MAGALVGNLNGARWIDAHDDFLRARLAQGESMAAAAVQLNAEFGTSYSRNACIGRASRKGMERNGAMGPLKRKAKEERPRRRKKAPALALSDKAECGLIKRRPPIESAPEAYTLRCVEVEARHIPLLDLAPEQCRWPYGDGPFTFCGHPAVFGSYCGPHYGLSCGPGTRSEQSANRVLRKVA